MPRRLASNWQFCPQWNTMTERTVFVVKPGTELFRGKVAPQGSLPGGGEQYFVPDLDAIEVFIP
jgi:hypothetical protein